ncbi:hypothetical protein [Amycolatopsis sp. YIM 10]|uniref:hypothetical protein n=1 Tax=Amycolatopsis sp. YIM 10 TaxID=2653857 RepID=UPI001290809D|nr:hypothetical protein [Amycolatopsis sp. YIM 10]
MAIRLVADDQPSEAQALQRNQLRDISGEMNSSGERRKSDFAGDRVAMGQYGWYPLPGQV